MGVSFGTTLLELSAICVLSKIGRQYFTTVIYRSYHVIMPRLTVQQRLVCVQLFHESEPSLTVAQN